MGFLFLVTVRILHLDGLNCILFLLLQTSRLIFRSCCRAAESTNDVIGRYRPHKEQLAIQVIENQANYYKKYCEQQWPQDAPLGHTGGNRGPFRSDIF